jgi:hypothetical protein
VCLWTISSRWYLNAALSFGLTGYFDETHAGDEIRGDWKDIRRLNVEYLIDDSDYHRNHAQREGLETDRYIVIPSYGGPQDEGDPVLWLRLIEERLLPAEGP